MIKERIKHENQVRKSYPSLGSTMFSTLLFALGVALVLFFGVNILADRYIQNRYTDAANQHIYYNIATIVSIVLAFVGFALVMWLYFFEITSTLTVLSYTCSS